jgi:Restriction endonuclease
VHSFAALTDHDFEMLIADLLGAEEGVRYEVFARGPDLGVDVRYEDGDGGWHVVQCKHYLRSTIANLRQAARDEAKKVTRLEPRPASYRFVTSRALTVANKRDLKQDLRPFIRRQGDILGENDVELLLGRHEAVERRHIKLWLPSSTQLRTLLASATYSRSKALAEEINDLLPRWVPGHVFFEARELLNRERVCVIAGVPGIGKTTLAKMLLADAIAEGYEAIAVSADIEEAWSVYDPGQRQIFYYDDFLGRTALTERLGKNEEDRLLTFMRRVAASRTTLFVLTTREYILQQARQLYEQLAIQGVEGRRFLLELQSYSRTDRARIFYNHAFFSGQLSRQARQALLADRAYEAIIDHRAYNPRQIEWITGLSGHQLTDEDNANYVAFAVAALDDPARIWRYGFEHQLDETQRALLLVLVTMSDQVEHDDLQRAFDSFAEVAGISTRRRAFERALKVLDDSFVRTYQDVGKVFIRPYDPSVADFLASYLADSPSDAKLAIRSAVFFEQVRSLSRMLRDTPLLEQAAGDYIDAVERCFQAPSCSWHQVYFGREATEPTTTREWRSLEDRADFIGQMKRWPSAYREEPHRSRTREVYAAAKQMVREGWADHRGDPDDAIRLLRGMRRRGEGITVAALAAKTLITSGLHYAQAFGRLIELRALAPSIFTEHEWGEYRREYVSMADQELLNWNEMGAMDEIDDLEYYAEKMGLELDRPAVREARQSLEAKIERAEDLAIEQARDRDEEEDIEPEPEAEDDDEEIEALFTRLAEQ